MDSPAMPTPVTLRPYRPFDLPEMIRLFRETIHTVNTRDYTPEQVAAWAPEQIDIGRWTTKLAAQEAVIAEQAGKVAGFCSWDTTGYIDLLYVHHAHQRQGIAALLLAEAEKVLRLRGITRLHTQASVTAQPFFLRQGYRLIKHQLVHVRGVDLPNAVMEKPLS